jgi:hypothetical protein
MLRVGFETTIALLGRAKTFYFYTCVSCLRPRGHCDLILPYKDIYVLFMYLVYVCVYISVFLYGTTDQYSLKPPISGFRICIYRHYIGIIERRIGPQRPLPTQGYLKEKSQNGILTQIPVFERQERARASDGHCDRLCELPVSLYHFLLPFSLFCLFISLTLFSTVYVYVHVC